MLSGSISGAVYVDYNGNGSRDSGEAPLAGITVFLDTNNNQSKDSGEPSTTTAADGSYHFTGLNDGTYSVQAVTATSYARQRAQVVTISGGSNASAFFGFYQYATISGVIFFDKNANGIQDAGEPGLTSLSTSVGVDIASPINLFPVVRGPNGTFTISRVPPGSIPIFAGIPAIHPLAWHATTPDPVDVAIHSGQDYTGLKFGFAQNNPRTGTLVVNGFIDSNIDGTLDNGEFLSPGSQLFVDLNGNGVLDTGEPTSFGSETLETGGLAPGSYEVRDIPPSGYFLTTPLPQGVTVSANAIASVDVGFAKGTPPPNGSTTVNIFNDLNGDGAKENNEPNLANVKVFLDLNNNGTLDPGEPSGLTNSSGLYTFSNLSSVPIYHVRVIGSGGLMPSGIGELDVIAANNQFSLGLYQPQTINGVVFNDANRNGGDDSLEGLAGWQVYIDLNKNGKLDASEPTATTNNSGFFEIPNVAPGTYFLRPVLQAGWSPETGNGSYFEMVISGQTPYGVSMALVSSLGSISGSVFIDSNANGKQDATESPAANFVVYDDVNNDQKLDTGDIQSLTDASGVYRLQVPVGTAHVRLHLPAGWVQTNSPTTAVKVVSGLYSNGPTFGVRIPNPGSISGRVFNDNNGNGIYDPQDGGVNDCTVYIDTNNDGKFDAGDIGTLTETSGQFSINYIPAGTYVLHETVGTLYVAEGPTSQTVVVKTNQTASVTFAQYWPSGIKGTVYNDVNGNTSFDTGEPVLSNIRVFLDLNDNGVLDSNEPSVLSDAMGAFAFTNLKPGVYGVTEQTPPKGMVFLSPVNGHIDLTISSSGTWVTNLGNAKVTTPVSFSGTVYNDLNLDAKQQSNEPGLQGFEFYVDYNNNSVPDPGEPTAFSNSAGVYTFNNIPTGRYLVRPIVPALWRLDGFVAWFATSDARNITGLNFAMTQRAWLGGRVFADFNGNGVFDSYESGLPGWTVYIDANNNGKLDPGEQSTTTNSIGQFNFLNGIAPGTYTIRIVQQSGYTLTTPASFTVTLAKGDSTRERFGEATAS